MFGMLIQNTFKLVLIKKINKRIIKNNILWVSHHIFSVIKFSSIGLHLIGKLLP